MSATPNTTDLLTSAPRVDTPERGYRVSRCNAHGAFAWKGSAPRPACPVCGDVMGTTTRQLRAAFTIMDGDLLTYAERLPGGLRASARFEREYAQGLRERVARMESLVASGEAVMDDEGTAWEMREPYDFERARGVTERQRSSGLRLALVIEKAEKCEAKADRYDRRLAKLGGPIG